MKRKLISVISVYYIKTAVAFFCLAFSLTTLGVTVEEIDPKDNTPPPLSFHDVDKINQMNVTLNGPSILKKSNISGRKEKNAQSVRFSLPHNVGSVPDFDNMDEIQDEEENADIDHDDKIKLQPNSAQTNLHDGVGSSQKSEVLQEQSNVKKEQNNKPSGLVAPPAKTALQDNKDPNGISPPKDQLRQPEVKQEKEDIFNRYVRTAAAAVDALKRSSSSVKEKDLRVDENKASNEKNDDTQVSENANDGAINPTSFHQAISKAYETGNRAIAQLSKNIHKELDPDQGPLRQYHHALHAISPGDNTSIAKAFIASAQLKSKSLPLDYSSECRSIGSVADAEKAYASVLLSHKGKILPHHSSAKAYLKVVKAQHCKIQNEVDQYKKTNKTQEKQAQADAAVNASKALLNATEDWVNSSKDQIDAAYADLIFAHANLTRTYNDVFGKSANGFAPSDDHLDSQNANNNTANSVTSNNQAHNGHDPSVDAKNSEQLNRQVILDALKKDLAASKELVTQIGEENKNIDAENHKIFKQENERITAANPKVNEVLNDAPAQRDEALKKAHTQKESNNVLLNNISAWKKRADEYKEKIENLEKQKVQAQQQSSEIMQERDTLLTSKQQLEKQLHDRQEEMKLLGQQLKVMEEKSKQDAGSGENVPAELLIHSQALIEDLKVEHTEVVQNLLQEVDNLRKQLSNLSALDPKSIEQDEIFSRPSNDDLVKQLKEQRTTIEAYEIHQDEQERLMRDLEKEVKKINNTLNLQILLHNTISDSNRVDEIFESIQKKRPHGKTEEALKLYELKELNNLHKTYLKLTKKLGLKINILLTYHNLRLPDKVRKSSALDKSLKATRNKPMSANFCKNNDIGLSSLLDQLQGLERQLSPIFYSFLNQQISSSGAGSNDETVKMEQKYEDDQPATGEALGEIYEENEAVFDPKDEQNLGPAINKLDGTQKRSFEKENKFLGDLKKLSEVWMSDLTNISLTLRELNHSHVIINRVEDKAKKNKEFLVKINNILEHKNYVNINLLSLEHKKQLNRDAFEFAKETIELNKMLEKLNSNHT